MGSKGGFGRVRNGASRFEVQRREGGVAVDLAVADVAGAGIFLGNLARLGFGFLRRRPGGLLHAPVELLPLVHRVVVSCLFLQLLPPVHHLELLRLPVVRHPQRHGVQLLLLLGALSLLYLTAPVAAAPRRRDLRLNLQA